MDRWNYDENATILTQFGYPKMLIYPFRIMVNRSTHAHGIGRHSKEEVFEIFKDDLGALSGFLGELQFSKQL